MHNDYVSLAHRKGMPEGHAPVVREMVMHIKRMGQIPAILSVGNKQTDYDETDVEIASLLGIFPGRSSSENGPKKTSRD